MAAQLVALIVSWTLAGIFLAAALHKVRAYLEFTGVLTQYRLLPKALVPVVAPIVVSAEVACGVMLLFDATRNAGLATALVLLTVYLGAIAINLARGRTEIDCGCGGEATPLSGWLLARNAVLLALAAGAMSTNVLTLPTGAYLLAVPTTALLWLLYVTVNQLLANWGKRYTPATGHG